MSYSPEQQAIIDRIKQIASRRKAGPKVTKAALETGAVESNFRNLPGGDADSQGWRQERASLYDNPRDLDASINRFITEALAVRHKYARAGDVAAAVQRPRAEYRGRYQERSAEADALLGPSTGRAGSGAGPATRTTTTSTFDEEGYDKARRLTILGNYLEQKNPNNTLLQLGVATPGGLPDREDFTKTTTSTSKLAQSITEKGYSETTAGLIETIKQRADRLDSKHFAYAWGGGHDKKRPAGSVPVDCSGAVSQALGIDPRVAAEFKSFGKPGRGRVTIYAKDSHVLMEINGHFFGTSGSNPGGGAGWIPRSAVSAQYLKDFTARHIDA